MKGVLFILSLVLLCSSMVLAEGTNVIATNQTASVEFGTLPAAPSVGFATILVFKATDTQTELSHIDAYVTISDAEGNILKDQYPIHTHGSQFSMSYTFEDSGQYLLSVLITPSSHYEGPKFANFTVDFPITVEESERTNSSALWYFLGVVLILGVLVFFIIKKSKKKHSGMQHPHQKE